MASGFEFGGEDFSILKLHVILLVEAVLSVADLSGFLKVMCHWCCFMFILRHQISIKGREGGHLSLSAQRKCYSIGHFSGGLRTPTPSVAHGNKS